MAAASCQMAGNLIQKGHHKRAKKGRVKALPTVPESPLLVESSGQESASPMFHSSGAVKLDGGATGEVLPPAVPFLRLAHEEVV